MPAADVPVGMSGCGGPAVTPVCCRRCFLRLDDAFTLPVTTWAFNGHGQLPGIVVELQVIGKQQL